MKNNAYEEKITSLRATIAWMDLVMANVNESILVLDDNWRIIFANSYLAEMLDSDRVTLLGKCLWDVVPMLAVRNNEAKRLPLKSIAKLNGLYELKHKRISVKLLLQSKYVPVLKQAVCIMSDVSIELNAENALMKLHKEIVKLQSEIAALKSN